METRRSAAASSRGSPRRRARVGSLHRTGSGDKKRRGGAALGRASTVLARVLLAVVVVAALVVAGTLWLRPQSALSSILLRPAGVAVTANTLNMYNIGGGEARGGGGARGRARARAAAAGAPAAVGIKDDLNDASFLDPREVKRMVDSGDLVLKSDGAPALLDDWESIGQAGKEVDLLLNKYTFHDSRGEPIDLNDAQKHKLLVKLVESRRMRGWQERLAREMETPDPPASYGPMMAEVSLPIVREAPGAAADDGRGGDGTAALEHLRRVSSLASRLLAADDTVMREWAEEKARGRAADSRAYEADFRDAQWRQYRDRHGGEAGAAAADPRAGGAAGAGDAPSAVDILYETVAAEGREEEQHILDAIRRGYRGDVDRYYWIINRLGLVDAAFSTPEYFAQKWQRYLSLTPDFAAAGFRGRGVVICGGGLGYIGALWLNVKMLRSRGSTLPIEIFGFGGEQPTPLLRAMFEAQGARFISMEEIVPGGSTLFRGYVVKIFAIIFSSFAEVLSLDSDAMPIDNVDKLFEHGSGGGGAAEVYSPEHGAVLWPDFWRASVDSDLLLSLGLHPDLNDWMGTHDSGQMVVNKEKGWDALMLASFMSLHAEAIYPMLTRNGIGIGDKEVLALCYRALRIPYFKVPRPITPVGFVSVKPNEKNEPREEDCERASDPRACRQLAQARQRVQDELRGWGSGERAETVFHGTTMAQYSPNADEGVVVMHKNCDKWLMRDAVPASFLGKKGWTHFKRFNATAAGGGARFTEVDAIVPRAPRVMGPGSVCEIDVFDSPAQPIASLLPDIGEVERTARRELHEFGRSEAYLEYERWRTLRFKERTETDRPSVARSLIYRDPHSDGREYNAVDNQVEEALEMLQAIRKKGGEGRDAE